MLKNAVLKILEEHKGTPVSGLQIGRTLGVSRSAVWKEIRRLKEEGFSVAAVPHKGYLLSVDEAALHPERVACHLKTKAVGRSLEVLETVDSTNTYLKRNAVSLTGKSGHTVIALLQTAGRGRMNRQFHSPAGHGLYMSIYLEPHFTFDKISLITVLTVTAVCRAVEEVAGFRPDVKWVNDVLYRDKKLCGILTEASFEAEGGEVRYLIVGIGINVDLDPALPEELQPIVGALNQFTETPCDRSRLAAAILNHFEVLYGNYLQGEKKEMLAEYKAHLSVFGKEYNVVSVTGSYPAVPVDIDDEAHLIVRDEAGVLHTLNSGEISIRKK